MGGAKVPDHIAVSMLAALPDLANEGGIVRECPLATEGTLELFGGPVIPEGLDHHLCARALISRSGHPGTVASSRAGTYLPLVPPRLQVVPCRLALSTIQRPPVHQRDRAALDGKGHLP